MEQIKSFFKFEIMQTTDVLLGRIKDGDGKYWVVKESEDPKVVFLQEIRHPENMTTVRMLPNILHITTVRGFVYVIEDKANKGANVTFSGPVNALLKQTLIPQMTYVPKTLRGMTSADKDGYMPIGVFMERRKARHNGQVNPQDKNGWKVNMRFNNELAPWLPAYKEPMNNRSFKRV